MECIVFSVSTYTLSKLNRIIFVLQDLNSVLVNGSCQIPDPLYKLIGSIISFYIPLAVMILTYTLTVRHLAAKRQNLQTGICPNSSNQSNIKLRNTYHVFLNIFSMYFCPSSCSRPAPLRLTML